MPWHWWDSNQWLHVGSNLVPRPSLIHQEGPGDCTWLQYKCGYYVNCELAVNSYADKRSSTVYVLMYCALQLCICQFSDLGDSVIAKGHSAVANGNFGDHVGNPCLMPPELVLYIVCIIMTHLKPGRVAVPPITSIFSLSSLRQSIEHCKRENTNRVSKHMSLDI